jgi:hypothetical protein
MTQRSSDRNISLSSSRRRLSPLIFFSFRAATCATKGAVGPPSPSLVPFLSLAFGRRVLPALDRGGLATSSELSCR